jgi:tetratricopeptide (TPR) repeat protein
MRGGTYILVVALALASAAPSCDTRRTDSLRALSDGMKSYRDGRQTNALEQFRESVTIDESNDLAHYYAGLLAFHQFQDKTAARRHLKKALDLDPSQAEYHYQYAAVLQADGDVAGAMPFLQSVLERNPKHGKAHYRMGMARRAKGELRPAAQILMKSIELSPRFDKAYMELGDIYLKAGHHAEAAQVLENCTRNAPHSAECFNEYGRALMAGENRKAAISAFNESLSRRPDFTGALFNLGMAYRQDGDTPKAKFYLQQYLKTADRRVEGDRVTAADQIVSGMSDTQ